MALSDMYSGGNQSPFSNALGNFMQARQMAGTNRLMAPAMSGDLSALNQLMSVNPEAGMQVSKELYNRQQDTARLQQQAQSPAQTTDLQTKLQMLAEYNAMPAGAQKRALGMIIGAESPSLSLEDRIRQKREEAEIELGTFGGKKEIELQTQPKIEGEKKKATMAAEVEQSDAEKLAKLKSGMTKVVDLTERLKSLGEAATYTTSGKAFNTVYRELGFKPTKGATARAQYLATIDNEIFPILKETLGSAFTETEAKALKATLGDPDLSPAEKNAQLDAFVEAKMREIKSTESKLSGGAQPVEADTELFNKYGIK